ncbi:hypothetical protein Cgig2_023300 [Carnegiea gigantea]|uniref:DAGKc domain-containing protein n=1 Tax=Carnegiea gigantea TaxID=171969 RepID=A0A9Q1JLD2_9CARY|nr:hypothetical protein Cgig2_023300 [Carnegiea gigantea]
MKAFGERKTARTWNSVNYNIQEMQNTGGISSNASLRGTQQSSRRLGFCSQLATGQHCSPVVFPEKRTKGKASHRKAGNAGSEDPQTAQRDEHKIDIGDEQSDLLGYEVFLGKLVLDKRKTKTSTDGQTSTEMSNQEAVDAKLTSKALVWGSNMLYLDDVISVSYNTGLRHFTVHSYPIKNKAFLLACFVKPQRHRKDFRFLASNPEEALQWVNAFADQQCYINCWPHPLVSSKKQHSDFLSSDFPFEAHVRCIVCVGGDGIVNEVLNGLLSRDNQKEAISIPIGIIPAGSDNSLVWTVLGVRDPISAAIAIVKGGLTATDVFAVEWIQSGLIHFGMTVSYFGFVSDVLELSETYQKRFGPLRYFVAGFLKFLCLPKYNFEVEYLPAETGAPEDGKALADREVIDMSDLYTDIMRKSSADRLPRASSLSSIDSIMSPSRISGVDMDTTGSSTHASTEPSEYVRGIDPKLKRLSSGRRNDAAEPEVIRPQLQLSTSLNWPRTRSKSRTDKGWTGLTTTHDATRCSWGNTGPVDKEDISSTVSDPGPIWDSEPKWDSEPNWDVENRIELPGPPPSAVDEDEADRKKEVIPRFEDKWVVAKGQFLGVLVCNHSCRSVQSSQVVAPNAEPDDNALDLLLVHGSGRLRLIRFFLRLQFGRHLALPYVEYVKVKSVKIKPGKHSHNGCGIDGELFPVHGQVITSLLPEQCRLIGRPPTHRM